MATLQASIAEPQLLSQVRSFNGWINTYNHQSEQNRCEMRFTVYLPPQSETNDNLPVLYWLSGLTCTEENFMTKSGAQRYAAEHGIIIVAPDTSPRGDLVPDDPQGAWDFGLGAGFYVNATEAPWSQHYRMYDYVVKELPALINQHFGVDPQRKSISGHSMGGHGALMIALKNPGAYRSVSAFAPIVAPMHCPWGEKAFSQYLGDNKSSWQHYDSCYLVEHPVEPQTDKLMLLIDQGEADGFVTEQLQPQLMQQSCEKMAHPLTLNIRPGYDHSYHFIASFIGEHIEFHAKALK
ncbi:MAG: S-formylglutathione hydrolase [Phenylobacterium sp.]|jgi:S-formylglutathione hydrolase